jgi:hypothetical protein
LSGRDRAHFLIIQPYSVFPVHFFGRRGHALTDKSAGQGQTNTHNEQGSKREPPNTRAASEGARARQECQPKSATTTAKFPPTLYVPAAATIIAMSGHTSPPIYIVQVYTPTSSATV